MMTQMVRAVQDVPQAGEWVTGVENRLLAATEDGVRCHVLSSQLGESHLVVVALADYAGTPADGGVLLVAENGKVSKAQGVFAGWAKESPARVALALIALDRLADIRLRAAGLNPLARGRYAVNLNAADVQGLLPPVPARWAA